VKITPKKPTYCWVLTVTDITTAGMVHASTQGSTNKQMMDITKDEASNNSGTPVHTPLACACDTPTICKISTQHEYSLRLEKATC